eukprot:5169207-Pyramimonas_sp.AAC.1
MFTTLATPACWTFVQLVYCTTNLEDASDAFGILRFIVSVPRLHSVSTLDRHFPSPRLIGFAPRVYAPSPRLIGPRACGVTTCGVASGARGDVPVRKHAHLDGGASEVGRRAVPAAHAGQATGAAAARA